MTDPGQLFARYLRQHVELGERSVVLAERMIMGTVLAQSASVVETRPAAGPAVAPTEAIQSGAGDGAPLPSGTNKDWRTGAPEIPPAGIVIAEPDAKLFDTDSLAEFGLDELGDVIRACTRCGLCRSRVNAVPGEGPSDARLMVVGEGPGATEDETGRPFVGRAGKLLDEILAAIDFPRETVFICNIVKCRPPKNRNPEPAEVTACLAYLHRQIKIVRPSVILAVGSVAAGTMLNSKGSLGSMRNKIHEFRGVPLVVTYHPAALLRNPHWKKPTWDDVRIARRLLD